MSNITVENIAQLCENILVSRSLARFYRLLSVQLRNDNDANGRYETVHLDELDLTVAKCSFQKSQQAMRTNNYFGSCRTDDVAAQGEFRLCGSTWRNSVQSNGPCRQRRTQRQLFNSHHVTRLARSFERQKDHDDEHN